MGGVNSNYLPWSGGSEKSKKGVEEWWRGKSSEKGWWWGSWHGLSFYHFIKVYYLYI